MDKKSVIAIVDLAMNYGVAAIMEALQQLEHLQNFTAEELKQQVEKV